MIQIIQNTLGPVMTNVYTVYNEESKEAFIVDPSDSAKVLIGQLEERGLKLKAILLTHAHFDHIGAVNDLKGYCPEAKVYVGEVDLEMLSDPGLNLSEAFEGNPVIVRADKTVRDNEVISILGMDIRCIHTPGHTSGSVSYYAEDIKSVFSGDTLFCGSVGRSDFPTGNENTLLRSIEEKLFTLPEDTNVLPGHDSLTTIGREKKYNMFFN